MSKQSPDVSSDSKERVPHRTPNAGMTRFAILSVILSSLAAPVNARPIPPKVGFANRDSSSEIVDSILSTEAQAPTTPRKPETAKKPNGINWGEITKNMDLIDFILGDLTSKPGKPSVFSLGYKLIANEPLSSENRRHLSELADKYKITDAEMVKKLLEKDNLTPEDYAFLRSKVLEIVRIQKQMVSISKRTRELLRNMSDSAIKHATEINLSSDDVDLFRNWHELMEKTIQCCERTLEQLGGFERDLIAGK